METETIQAKSIKEIEDKINKEFKGLGLSEYDISPILEKAKNKFIEQQIKTFNVLEIENHQLKNIHNDDFLRELVYSDKVFNFEQVKKKIETYFKKFNKEDRIKEVMLFLDYDIFKENPKTKYFSLWDFKRKFLIPNQDKNLYDTKKMKEEISNKINTLKEFKFSYSTDNYYITNYLNKLKTLLNLLFGIDDINYKYEYKKPYGEYEKEINKSKNIKVRMFNGWFYLSFNNKEQEKVFKNILIEQMFKRVGDI